ncbi:NAD(P)H-binding protein [Rhodococcus antarcticus]|uniref:NAD(P)H-binding protein n=1 Tax=Rhodococcus antarcticus TaxID=2987751 RepID=A0ABY6NZG3_9NOCA|nr:NAD(P)H-binding protein [Rhodococcus antarcticus]UZJ24794.1 NAD(P)H-binding protein [Rhodococcus antarcticus]
MIVVAGGSGLLGHHVVANLLAQGETVRVLVRDTTRARALFGDTVEVVGVDVRRGEGLDELTAGASVVVSAVHGFLGGRGAGPVEVDERGNAHLVDAATANGVGVVLVSVLGASADSPLDLFRAKHSAEQHLRGSGTPWTIVRASAFLETWLDILTRTAHTSGRPLIFGRGQQPIPFVSALDVAAAISRAATDTTLRGHVLEIAGEPMTMTELARALQAAQGWHGTPRHLPRLLLRSLAVLARPISPALARQNRTALAMDAGILTGPAPTPGPLGPPRQTLPAVLARLAS